MTIYLKQYVTEPRGNQFPRAVLLRFLTISFCANLLHCLVKSCGCQPADHTHRRRRDHIPCGEIRHDEQTGDPQHRAGNGTDNGDPFVVEPRGFYPKTANVGNHRNGREAGDCKINGGTDIRQFRMGRICLFQYMYL